MITTWMKRGELWNRIPDMFACVGVGLKDELSQTMPIYDVHEVFKRGVDPKLTKLQRVIAQAEQELNESEDDL
ncbi:Cell division cycle protein 123 [Frankliniella fusca]|uniref:Cell division cycle protein 123 n=1 Tax=Frankliniella fusca TaxID=407009 RepID=A0AAE1H8G2_9NEOP|nr:Cell division cycle protein 123 [Frankliniella fusca]